MRGELRGWVESATMDVWCLDCAPSPGEVRVLVGLAGDDERMRLLPVGDDWADRTRLTCDECGRPL